MLEVKELSKVFGETKALNSVSFKIEKGQAFGVLGRNGAGKTTFIRILLGLLKKDGGEILYNGKELKKDDLKVGYLPEERGLYLKYTVKEQLVFFAKMNNMKKNEYEIRIKELLKMFKIEEYFDKKIEELSKGNKQKVQVIVAMLNNPDLLILDEPFSGLDPVNVELFKTIIKDFLKKENKTIVFSSHQMNNVEEFCENVVLFKKGNIVLKGSIEEIKEKFADKKVSIKTDKDIEDLIKKYSLELLEKEENKFIIKYKNEKQVDGLIKDIIENDIHMECINYIKPSLNEIFIRELGD